MQNTKPKIIVILGPTASGKTSLSIQIAKKFNGEIISADSRQVYKGLNVGTGKVTKKEMSGVKHYLLDVANPKKQFSVAQFKEMADEAIIEILSKGKTPIICGGTGFYIDTVVNNTTLPEVPPNTKLRKQLSKKTAEELFETLKKLDSERAKNIDSKNKIRIIRAIEIAKALGKVPTIKNKSKYDVLYIGTKISKEDLKKKIHDRLVARIKIGMINEAKKLHQKGLSWKKMNELGLEYRYLALFLTGKISKNEMVDQLYSAICKYAKRQMTWFQRNKEIRWVEPKNNVKVESLISKFLIK